MSNLSGGYLDAYQLAEIAVTVEAISLRKSRFFAGAASAAKFLSAMASRG